MGGKVNYTIVGLFVVVLTVLLIAMGLILGDRFSQTKEYDHYVTYVNESVAGLNVNSLVKFNGVNVGYVDQITIDKTDPQRVKLGLSIEQGAPITRDTEAVLQAQGLTGIGYLELDPKGQNNTRLQPTKEEPIPVIPSKPSFMNGLQKKIDKLAENLDEMGENLSAVFDTENQQNLKQSLRELNETLRYARTIARNTEIASHQFPEAVDGINRSAKAFEKMTVNIDKTSLQVAKTMQDSELVLQSFSTQVMPLAVSLLNKIQKVMSNLTVLSAEAKQNPAVLLRGRAQNAYGPGEGGNAQELKS